MSPVGVRGEPASRGKRRAMQDSAAHLAANAPQLMRELLAPHVGDYVNELIADMKDRGSFSGEDWIPNPAHRTAMQLIPQILKAINADSMLVLAFVNRLGARDEDELRRFVQLGQSAHDVTSEQADQQWLTYGRRRIKSDPSFRQWAREVLFGEREVEQETPHENGNGDVRR